MPKTASVTSSLTRVLTQDLFKSTGPTAVSNSKSLAFDGTNDKLVASYQLPSTFTVSYWINRSAAGTRYAFDARDASNTSAIYVHTSDEGSGYKLVSNAFDDSAEIALNEWHNIVITYDSPANECKLYVDGSLDNTKGSVSLGTAASELTIGTRYTNFAYLKGHLDEFSVWDTALDADTVAAIYNSGTPIDLSVNGGGYASSGDLKVWWRMGDATEPAADGTSDLIFDQADKTLGSELVTNGDYETGDFTGWTTHNSGGQTLEVATNAAGSNALHIVSDGTFCGVTQDITKPAGTVFKFCFDLEVISGSAVTVIEGVINTHSNSGRYEIFGTSSGSTISLEIKRNLTCEFYIDNVSVKEVNGATATMTNMDSGDIVQYTPNSYILSDLGITPDLAVSMTRKLVSDYSGSFYATSGSDVTTIYDQSGNSRNLTNYGSGDEVTLSGSGNLARAVFSSSSNSVLTTSTLGSAFPAGNHDVFMVFDPVGTDQQILFGRASTGGDFLAMDNGSSSNASNGITIGEIRVNDTILPATVSRNELWDAMTVSGTMGGLNVLSLEDVDLSSIGGDIRLGASNDTWRLEGSFAEFIITPPLSDAQHSAIVENIRAHYDAP